MDVYTNYSVYKYTKSELAFLLIKYGALIFVCGFLLFNSVKIGIMLLPCAFIFLINNKKYLKLRRDDLISRQFCDALQFISSSLSTGKTFEGALKDSYQELKLLYGTENEIICTEIKIMITKMSINKSIIEVLSDFAVRVHNADIDNFLAALRMCRIMGGNLNEVVKNTHYIMELKLETKNDIDMIMTEQRLNLKILICIPFILMGILKVTCPEYIKPLYEGSGRIVICTVLCLMVVALFIGRRITRFEF